MKKRIYIVTPTLALALCFLNMLFGEVSQKTVEESIRDTRFVLEQIEDKLDVNEDQRITESEMGLLFTSDKDIKGVFEDLKTVKNKLAEATRLKSEGELARAFDSAKKAKDMAYSIKKRLDAANIKKESGWEGVAD